MKADGTAGDLLNGFAGRLELGGEYGSFEFLADVVVSAVYEIVVAAVTGKRVR